MTRSTPPSACLMQVQVQMTCTETGIVPRTGFVSNVLERPATHDFERISGLHGTTEGEFRFSLYKEVHSLGRPALH
jgi:hypothetical protein